MHDDILDAVRSGDIERVRRCLEFGERPDELGKGTTALHEATARGNLEMVELFVRHGAEVRVRDRYGKQPVDIARSMERKDLIELLLRSTAEYTDTKSEALFEYAINDDGRDMEVALRAGADPMIRDDRGWTPLHYAAETGSKNAAMFLLIAGADPRAETADGATPIAIAREEEHLDVLELCDKPASRDRDLADYLMEIHGHTGDWIMGLLERASSKREMVDYTFETNSKIVREWTTSFLSDRERNMSAKP